jgi:RNA polymerase-interacting CarD/CdnL/TRCF family regulator
MSGLTTRDSNLLERASALLASEIALVKDIALEEAERELQLTLSQSLASLAPENG